MREFQQIRQEVLLKPRVLTREEYRIVKSVDWYNQKKFLITHLTEAGFQMYNNSTSQGRHGRWFVYLEIWQLINTPLFRALSEDK